MEESRRSARPKRAVLGPIDPFCWFAVLPLVAVAALVGLDGELGVGSTAAAVAVLLLGMDARLNRP